MSVLKINFDDYSPSEMEKRVESASESKAKLHFICWLDLLSNLELINKMNFGSNKSLYVFSQNNSKDLSIYLVCENCHKVIVNNKCLNSAIRIKLIDDAENNVFKNCNLRINNFQIFFSGLCDKCST